MRKLLISSLFTFALAAMMFSVDATRATSLEISSSPAAFLPYVSKQGAATPTAAPSRTPPAPTAAPAPTQAPPPTAPALTVVPPPTAPPLNPIAIVELSGHSDPEYVDIYNSATTAQDMTDWYIVSVIGGETFYFPDGYILGSTSLVQIESGQSAVNNPPLQLLWGSGTIWNDSGDKAILYDNSNQVVSSACYGIGCALGSTASGVANK